MGAEAGVKGAAVEGWVLVMEKVHDTIYGLDVGTVAFYGMSVRDETVFNNLLSHHAQTKLSQNDQDSPKLNPTSSPPSHPAAQHPLSSSPPHPNS